MDADNLDLSNSATILLSGGIDSTACAYFLREQGFNINGLFFYYGQASQDHEENAVKKICESLKIPLLVSRIPLNKKFQKTKL